MLMLSLIGIAIAIYMFLPAPLEKQSTAADIIETAQLSAETDPPIIYNEEFSPSPSEAGMANEDSSKMEIEMQDVEQPHPYDDDTMPPPSGGEW